MKAADALSRTLLLMRVNLLPGARAEQLLDALTSVRVELVADAENLASAEAEHAFVATALLIARSGGQVFLNAPNAPLTFRGSPLSESRLLDAVLDVGSDLVSGMNIRIVDGTPNLDLAVVVGDAEYTGSARRVMHLSASAWTGRLGSSGDRWTNCRSPFGALAAAGLAAAEAYKEGMRRLRHLADSGPFEEFFAASQEGQVALAPPGTPPPVPNLGMFDMLSGGAIIQAALYALSRIPYVSGDARVIEPDVNDLSNINRYSLLRRCGVGKPKAVYLAEASLGNLGVTPVTMRYDYRSRHQIGGLRAHVLVGVDNVESRVSVQEEGPDWVGIGATEDYFALTSIHTAGMPCIRCVHEAGSAQPGDVPTAAFVSHWAGLALAAAFARSLSCSKQSSAEQLTQLNCLQLGSPGGIRRTAAPAREDCGCVEQRGP